MANATVSNLGQDNGAGSTSALFLVKFSGEVLATFLRENVMLARHMVRTIDNGKSAQFPAMGKNTAAYHTPGAEIVGSAILHSQRTIAIDSMLVSSAFVADIDEAMNHYDVRGEYAKQNGSALAVQFDKNVSQVGLLAARASTTITGGNGGSALTNAAMGTDGEILASNIFSAVQKLDEKDVPSMDRYAVVRPAQYYLLAQTTKVINKDWGGAGVYADGSILRIASAEIVKSNNLPSTNINSGPSAYQGDFTKTIALVYQKGAMGTVKLLDLSSRADYDPRRLGTLLVSKYAIGHGILRPECAVELATP